MRRKELANNLKIVLISLVFSLLYWWICNRYYINQPCSNELYRQINASIYGYSSLQSYFLIYLVPFLIGLYVYSKREMYYIIARLKNRKSIIYLRIKMLIHVVVYVFIPHFFVNILGNIYLFNFDYLWMNKYFVYEFLQIMSVLIFFFVIGLLYQVCTDYKKQESSLLVISLATIAYYFFNRIFIKYVLLRELCMKDLFIAQAFSFEELFFTGIKYLIIIIFIVVLMSLKVREKDIL